MNLKSVLLSAPIRVAGSPALKKWEADFETLLTIEPPFVVVGMRKGGVVHRVGVPAISVQQVEFVEEPESQSPPPTIDVLPPEADMQAKGKKGKA